MSKRSHFIYSRIFNLAKPMSFYFVFPVHTTASMWSRLTTNHHLAHELVPVIIITYMFRMNILCTVRCTVNGTWISLKLLMSQYETVLNYTVLLDVLENINKNEAKKEVPREAVRHSCFRDHIAYPDTVTRALLFQIWKLGRLCCSL